MRPPTPILVGFLVLSILARSPVGATSAQDGTPNPGSRRADPADCRVAPRTLDGLLALHATPSAATATPVAFLTAPPVPLPPGAPADPATVADVDAARQEMAACIARGDELRLLALYSDDWLRRTFPADDALLREIYDARSTPTPQSGIAATPFVAVRSLADGRVGVVTDAGPPPETPVAAGQVVKQFLVYVEVDGRYLIDDILSVDLGPLVTPTP